MRRDIKDFLGLLQWWEDKPWSQAQEPRPRVLRLYRPSAALNWKLAFNLLIWIETPWNIRSQDSLIYVGPIPLILRLGLLWVFLGTIPSSQLKAISQCLHASDHSPIAQIHCVIDSTGMCLRWHSSAEHKYLVWPNTKINSRTTSLGEICRLWRILVCYVGYRRYSLIIPWSTNCLIGMYFLIHPLGWINHERMALHCLKLGCIGLYKS